MPELLRQFPPQWAGRGRAGLRFLTAHSGLLICLLFLLAGLAQVGDYGNGVDESIQRRLTRANLNYILGQADRVATVIPHDRVYGVSFELPLMLLERALGLEDYHYSHRLRVIITHLFFIVGGFFCYRLAYQLFNHRGIAVLALLLYLLHPRIYGHSFFNSKDLPFLSVFVIALYLLERAFRRDTMGAFILLGAAAGVLTNLRIMGAMLFLAVIALRGLDWFYAGSGPERKAISRQAGAFLLAGGLTVYALAPHAWTNPVDYLLTSFSLTFNHPFIEPQLFRGAEFLSNQLPPHYNAVWFGIATPLPLLLLGGIGAAVVAIGGRRRFGLACRNNRLRFQLLLLAAFLLPPLAAALLGSTQYDGWRHFYFLYPPFCLLAAGGLGWLLAARAGRRLWRAGMYGLTGLGLGLILLQITQLHPLQHYYFNPLVDRTSPEYLRTQYRFSFPKLARWAALQHLLKRHPEDTVVVRLNSRQSQEQDWPLLAPADRARLLLAASGRQADYAVIYGNDGSRPDLAFNTAYRRIYNNTIYDLQPLTAARMTPAAIAAYRELYRQAVAGEPVIRADYNVYRQGNRLTLVKENCPPGEPDTWFVGKLFRRQQEALYPLGSGDAPFVEFPNHRVQLGGLCLAVIQLPDYAQGDLVLAQRALKEYGAAGWPRWERLYNLDGPGLGELIAQKRRRQPAPAEPAPAGPAAFAVFLDQATGRHRLLYAKADCSREEYETSIFLHIIPENLADLPFYLWPSGVDNRAFALPDYGARPGGECMAAYPLPDYPIAALLTGQAGVWERNIYPPADPERLRAAYAALPARPPAAAAAFDLYIQDNQLIYLRETCAAADRAAGFFLHIVPVNNAALPAERRPAGFANRDFDFDRWGGPFDGKCLAAVPLPDYPIKSLRTGQHIPGQGELWAAELGVER